MPRSVLVSKHIRREAMDRTAGRVAVVCNDSRKSLSGKQLRFRPGGKHPPDIVNPEMPDGCDLP